VVFSKDEPFSAVERSVEAHIVAVNIHGKSDAAVVLIQFNTFSETELGNSAGTEERKKENGIFFGISVVSCRAQEANVFRRTSKRRYADNLFTWEREEGGH